MHYSRCHYPNEPLETRVTPFNADSPPLFDVIVDFCNKLPPGAIEAYPEVGRPLSVHKGVDGGSVNVNIAMFQMAKSDEVLTKDLCISLIGDIMNECLDANDHGHFYGGSTQRGWRWYALIYGKAA